MEQKKFMDIQRLKEGYADGFVPGDLIVIQEKFDGSNAAARYDAETGKMVMPFVLDIYHSIHWNGHKAQLHHMYYRNSQLLLLPFL